MREIVVAAIALLVSADFLALAFNFVWIGR
jgi:hypothetical protein